MPQTRLTPQEAHRLQVMQVELQELRMDIERLKRAGIDTAVHESTLATVERQRAGLLREFAPTGRKSK